VPNLTDIRHLTRGFPIGQRTEDYKVQQNLGRSSQCPEWRQLALLSDMSYTESACAHLIQRKKHHAPYAERLCVQDHAEPDLAIVVTLLRQSV